MRRGCRGVAIRSRPRPGKTQMRAIVDINGHGISTSGSYRNCARLDGSVSRTLSIRKRGAPLNTITLVSVTVIAPAALEANGCGTPQA
ncbi:FAD:protein FMN transferase [Salmonella enterica subsp. enterica]|nr:FAD:protein FMN transferase [Salmonella enterica subsp. enterica]